MRTEPCGSAQRARRTLRFRDLRCRYAAIVVLSVGLSSAAAAQPRLDVFTAAFLNPDSTSSLLVGVEIDGIASGDAKDPGEVTVRCEAVRDGAEPVVASRTVRTAEVRDDAAATGGALRVLTRMGLAPGRYTLSVTVQAAGGDATRAVRSIDVPALAVGQLSMSDLLVSATRVTGATAGVDQDGHVMPLVGHPPTARRTFARDERLEIDAEIYQVDLSGTTPDDEMLMIQGLSIETSVLTEAGEVVYSMMESGQGETLPSGAFGYPHYTLVPIARLKPGRYVVRVSANDNGVSVSRSVPITIVDELR